MAIAIVIDFMNNIIIRIAIIIDLDKAYLTIILEVSLRITVLMVTHPHNVHLAMS